VYSPTEISFSIITLGCSKNQVDAEKLNGSLIQSGFSAAKSIEESNLLIINTCGFITPAKEESIEIIFDALDTDFTGKHPFGRKVIVTGCLSQRYEEELKNDIPEIDFMYGLLDNKFLSILCDKFNIAQNVIKNGRQTPLVKNLSYQYIKIAEGCSNNCSYCAIPLIRGPFRPFGVDDIMQDVDDALANNVLELDIIAQDTSIFSSDGMDLSDLINKISSKLDDQWIRILYCHPDHISEKLIETIRENKNVVRYVDMPMQHISEKVLSSMGRKGNYRIYSDLIDNIREKVPGIKLRSTFMTGYPLEEEEDFKELLDFVKEKKIDKVGVFSYSPEEGTRAGILPLIDESVVTERYNELMNLQQDISRSKLQQMVGTSIKVIVEERVDEETFLCRSEFDAPEVDGVFYLTSTDQQLPSLITAEVTDSIEYDLFGIANEH
jgi:ribosomal protein S12 methylthiotransferase